MMLIRILQVSVNPHDMYNANSHFLGDVQNMVFGLRHTELASIIGVSGESRDGRKPDLKQRVLSMIDRGISPAIESKIRDLYRKSGASSSSRNSSMYSRRLPAQTSSSLGTSMLSRSGMMCLI